MKLRIPVGMPSSVLVVIAGVSVRATVFIITAVVGTVVVVAVVVLLMSNVVTLTFQTLLGLQLLAFHLLMTTHVTTVPVIVALHSLVRFQVALFLFLAVVLCRRR